MAYDFIVIIFMCPGSISASSWNVDLVVDILNSKFPSLAWTRVVEELDHKELYIPDKQGFSLMMRCLTRGLGNQPFPLSTVISRVWDNTSGQISFLNHAVTTTPDVFSFENSKRKLAISEPLQVILDQMRYQIVHSSVDSIVFTSQVLVIFS